ncbi:MAG: hypothetical protein A2008_13965 [Candidatus Wallbacteria bacterium GWC2_49_35]|uniref:Type II secretion system protein GspG C-terminal domain-containing protein n=1 Tax=Candidatus Wallbacteria bacterium GWC2_49_35 TaxID=1817813 RepID=A0A1F7WVY1_9BACT|nr:MAG: hypothetical protein A2008_13965 [Candidatus Wallbacteria bacterium GWC2_49_35]HBC74535.1 hypothetical protein [Candidatus Wallbacteria bacterium]
MNGNQILSLVGLIIVIAGIFCPIISVPVTGDLNLWGNGDAEGAVVLGISIAILICIFITMDKGVIFLGVINLAIISAVFIGFQIKISGGSAIQLQWGWALLALGSFLLLFGAWEKNFVMVIACIVGAGLMSGALAYFNFYMEAEKTRNIAVKDCERLSAAYHKYYETEGREIETLNELQEKYVPDIDTLKDPWGNDYEFDNVMKKIYSKGPDAKAKTSDDVAVFVNRK